MSKCGSWAKRKFETYFPAKYRYNAEVAALRTFGQNLNGSWIPAGGTSTYLTTELLNEFDWRAIVTGVGVSILTAGGAALRAWWDVASKGLSPKYIAEKETDRPASSVGEVGTNVKDVARDNIVGGGA